MGRKRKKRHGRAPGTPAQPPGRGAAPSAAEPAPNTAPLAEAPSSPSARGAWAPVLVLLAVLLGAGAAAAALSGGDGGAPTADQAASVAGGRGAPGTAGDAAPGRGADAGGGRTAGSDVRREPPAGTPAALFTATCAPCHSLAAARRRGAPAGTIGPDLDDLHPKRERVLAAIRNGGLGGVMPAGLLGPRSARRVAAYVARVAGARPDSGGP
jgi:hypothetical protein